MKLLMSSVKKVDDCYMIEGNSQRFPTLEGAVKYMKNSRKKKSKSQDGRRFWSDKIDIPMRSTWELTIAELFNELGIEWEYEPERVYFRKEHESYLCDFFLPEYNCWVEIKGWMDKRSEKRCKLFKRYYGAKAGYFIIMKEEMELLKKTPELIYTYLQIAEEERERVEKRL